MIAMKKFHVILSCFIFLILFEVSAQNVKFSFETGVGTYSMTDLKSFINTSTKDNPLDPVMVSNFPPYFYFSPSISLGIKNHNLGTRFSLISSGARSSIKDYSGEYRFDGTVSGFGSALFDEVYIHRSEKYGVLFRLDIGGIYSKLKLHEFFQLNDIEQLNESYHFFSMNLYTLPGLKFDYNISENFSLFANAGYHIDIFKSPLYIEGSKRNMYLTDRNSQVKVNWNGVRIGLGISYKL